MEDPDEALVQAALDAPEGDTRAFEALVLRHESAVRLNCRYLTRSGDDAQDLAQEVFVKAFFGLRRFERRSTFKSWVERIKVNHCLNFVRKRKRATFVDIEEPALAEEPGLRLEPQAPANLERMDRQAAIRTALEQMPETLRVALVLRDLDEMSYQEVADALGIGLSATKMRIKRAREDFRRRFSELEPAASARSKANR